LRELLGAQLDDPATRFELLLVLAERRAGGTISRFSRQGDGGHIAFWAVT
jgi:hypothetical protein